MMKPSTFGFLTVRGIRNLGKHWAMTIACIASLSVCMTLNTFAHLVAGRNGRPDSCFCPYSRCHHGGCRCVPDCTSLPRMD